MGITREHVSRQDGEICHRILIRNFSDRMRDWLPGRSVRLRTVYVDRVPLKLKIYPNGERHDDIGHVSCVIDNIGDKDIEMDFELRIKEMKIEFEDFQLTPNQSFRIPKYFSHFKLLVPDVYSVAENDNSDEALEIHWTIKTKSLQEKYTKLSEKYEILSKNMDDDKEMMMKLIRDLLEDKKNTLEMLNVLKTYFSALVQKG